MCLSIFKKCLGAIALSVVFSFVVSQGHATDSLVDYVNPYIGNIRHLLVPTSPTVHLPYSMMRIVPQRGSYTESRINGFQGILVGYRGNSCFNISVTQGKQLSHIISTDYDNEVIKPYYYKVDVDEQRVEVEFTPSHHSAMYRFHFLTDSSAYIIVNSENGEMTVRNGTVSGYQNTWNGVKVYIYGLFDVIPEVCGILKNRQLDDKLLKCVGNHACVAMRFNPNNDVIFKYGISYISLEQARRNLLSEIADFNFDSLKAKGRKLWNRELGKIMVEGGSKNDKIVFYTSLYRCFERPVNISEGGRYFSPSNHKVYNDDGHPFYTDDWLWDTYLAAHPLRLLISPEMETDILRSFIRTGEQTHEKYFPNFPTVTGDRRSMNCNHGIAVVADAWVKGLRDFDLSQAYTLSRNSLEKKTLLPWESHPQCHLDTLYHQLGYMPALHEYEKETEMGVNGWEKRQAVSVTLGTAFDYWCLAVIADALGKTEDANYYLKQSYNYRNLFNANTSFFHPKDANGNFIEPFDYRFSGGIGVRDYYDENNGWTYRWDVKHNVGDLLKLMGGSENFCNNLDQTFNEWLGRNRYEFYAQLPDQTGNVGQFAMGNEPSLHIPYLYNYAGKPWKTQKRIRDLIHEWFRNDLMGVPGDEDGGGMSAFVVFSMMGFYPVTPGSPSYNIGSPFFEKITIRLPKGKIFMIDADNCSEQNKYILYAKINGKPCNQPWFSHDAIKNGGTLKLFLGNKHNALWGSSPTAAPPSAVSLP